MEGIEYKIKALLHKLETLTFDGREFAFTEPFVLTNYILWLIVAFFVTLVFFLVAARQASLVPRGLGNAAEAAVEFVRDSICVDVMGPEGRKYLPFIGTLFFFILFSNLIGLLPIGYYVAEGRSIKALAGTGTMGVTATWALIVFFVYHTIGFRKNGLLGYLKSFIPTGTPVVLAPVIFVLEIISHTLRPLTLSIRLYANIYAGSIILGIFGIFVQLAAANLQESLGAATIASSLAVGGLSMVMLIVMYAFKLFVSLIQAYVFAILTSVYIGGALHAAEH